MPRLKKFIVLSVCEDHRVPHNEVPGPRCRLSKINCPTEDWKERQMKFSWWGSEFDGIVENDVQVFKGVL